MRLTFLLLVFSFPAAAEPLVIAHRGASGYFPEHTLAAYEAAIAMGADYIEPDLVLTRDGHFVARHDVYLSTTSDVAEVFPDRERQGPNGRDWFVMDFTLDEIQKLRARQSYPGRSASHDGESGIPTLEEIIALVHQVKRETGREVGIYPELKSPEIFRELGFDMGTLLLDALAAQSVTVPVLIQSFDPVALRGLAGRSPYPLIMLLYPRSPEAINEPNLPLAEVSTFADGVGVAKALLFDQAGQDSGFTARAKSLGLTVHAWTFRDDDLPPEFESGAAEISRYLELGIDGVFTDFPDTGVRARNSSSDNRSAR